MKTLTKIFSFSLLLALFTVCLFVTSCSHIPPVTHCVNCDEFPLVYQGTITNYTKGTYIQTACISIDLSKFSGFDNFQIGDIIYVEYKLKQGNFCDPGDKSTYTIKTIRNDSDFNSDDVSEISGPGSGITINNFP